MQDRLSPCFEIECKRADVLASGEFAGYASTFGGTPDAYGDVIASGAFGRSLGEHQARGTTPAMLWAHDPGEPIGKWLALSEDPHGLAVKGKLTLDTRRGAEAHALLKDGALALSIGFRAVRSEPLRTGGRLLTGIDLYETSLVAMPANPHARVTAVKSRPSDVRSFEMQLRDALGFSSREARRIAGPAWRALERRDDDSDEAQQVAALLQAAAQSFTTTKDSK